MFSERRVFRGPPSGRAICLVRRLALPGLVTHRSSPRSVEKGKGKRRGGNFSSPQPSVACHPWEAGQSLRFSFFNESKEWRRPGSNRQPPACKAGALPVELRPPRAVMSSGWRPDRGRRSPERTASPQPAPVGTRGFEPRTSALSELRSNQLSYAPILTGAAILAHPPVPVQPSGSVGISAGWPRQLWSGVKSGPASPLYAGGIGCEILGVLQYPLGLLAAVLFERASGWSRRLGMTVVMFLLGWPLPDVQEIA